MGLIITAQVIVKVENQVGKPEKPRLSFPPLRIHNPIIENSSIEFFEKTSSKEIRRFLRNKAGLPPFNPAGLPYAFRIYTMGGRGCIKTLFPHTKKGEKIFREGRLDEGLGRERYRLAIAAAQWESMYD